MINLVEVTLEVGESTRDVDRIEVALVEAVEVQSVDLVKVSLVEAVWLVVVAVLEAREVNRVDRVEVAFAVEATGYEVTGAVYRVEVSLPVYVRGKTKVFDVPLLVETRKTPAVDLVEVTVFDRIDVIIRSICGLQVFFREFLA